MNEPHKSPTIVIAIIKTPMNTISTSILYTSNYSSYSSPSLLSSDIPAFQSFISRSDILAARNTKSYKPIDDFDGECVTNALECIIMDKSANEVARIHIPIHLMLNRYGHAALNDWDGNSVSIDKDGNGVILAPQIGAGQKEKDPDSEYYNSFTGMLMGTVKEAGRNDQDIGLFGYSKGQRSLFLNSKNGSAIFGKNGPGQIILDPAASKAMLYSSSY